MSADLIDLLQTVFALLAIVAALAAAGWYTGQSPRSRPALVATYLIAIFGILAFAWVMQTLLTRLRSS